MTAKKDYIATSIVWILIITSCILTSIYAQTQMYTVNSHAAEPQEKLAVATSFESGMTNPVNTENEKTETSQMTFYVSNVSLQLSEDGQRLEIEIPGMLTSTKYDVRNLKGEIYMNGYATENLFSVDISDFAAGTYFLVLDDRPENILQFDIP